MCQVQQTKKSRAISLSANYHLLPRNRGNEFFPSFEPAEFFEITFFSYKTVKLVSYKPNNLTFPAYFAETPTTFNQRDSKTKPTRQTTIFHIVYRQPAYDMPFGPFDMWCRMAEQR